MLLTRSSLKHFLGRKGLLRSMITSSKVSPRPSEMAGGVAANLAKAAVEIQVRDNPTPKLVQPKPALAPKLPIVNSYNEWDPLEEVIVGRVEGSTIPEWHVSGKAVWPERHWSFFQNRAGESFPRELIDKAAVELDYLAKVLTDEGIVVRRPDVPRFDQSVKTPDFETPTQLYAAMPRDVLLVVGNEIIEAPMAWRSRYFEFRPYRRLIKSYFHQGARWTAAPKPQMSDALYDEDWGLDRDPAAQSQKPNFSSVVTEFEPVFDAAEFTRLGRDLVTQRSQVTNRFGIDWLARHLGPGYRIHVLDFQDRNAMHIDGTFVPLMPGKILVNPYRPCTVGETVKTYGYRGRTYEYKLPRMFRDWDVLVAPTPDLSPDAHPLYFTSPWTATCNVLVLGPGKVVVEAHETAAQACFREWGFEVLTVPFRNFMAFGGSFHCATVDIRRRGTLQSYFD